MRVPEFFLKSSGFVVTKESAGPTVISHDIWASGFFVGVPAAIKPYSFFYFVTAEHAVAGLKGDLGIRINLRSGGPAIGGGIERWYTHPTDPHADVAVTPFRNFPEFDLLYIPLEHFRTRAEMERVDMGIGDEVFFPGLFAYSQGEDMLNHPIVRYGNIAMMPTEKIRTGSVSMDAYLVEARSIGGISGSPVFARRTASIIVNDSPEHQTAIHGLTGEIHLIGMVHGHWDIKESDINSPQAEQDRKKGVNMGIAIVIPAEKILETINHPDLVAMRKANEHEHQGRTTPMAD